MNSCMVSLQCAVSHGPEGSIFVKTIFYKTNSYKLSLQRNSRMTMMVTQQIELMAGKGFHPLCTLVQILRMSVLLNDFVQRRHLKGFSPVCTLKWFWRMCALVCFWTTQNTKLFCTLKAVVCILTRVYSFHVVHKDTFLWKTCFTKWTVVLFLSSVQSLMVLKIVFSWKWFVTN